jgi:hypothetical protein
MISERDKIKSLSDIGICLQTIIKSRYKKNVRPIYTSGGRYRSIYISFYRSPHVFQFYVEDRHNQFFICLLKNEKIIRKDIVKYNESIDYFYKRISYFFGLIN